MKDFIFSHEPSSWRFDVNEELYGYPQVVDFTDDATGAPHALARANMSMYVNEVGHNMDLVENVVVSVRCLSCLIQKVPGKTRTVQTYGRHARKCQLAP